jgi:hypothetical protein
MNMKKKTCFWVCIAVSFLFSGNLFSQSNPVYVPNVIPPSPVAASLMKFSDVPVSPYTGATNISVPIYTIEARGISVPVSLNYHSGGIHLKEEAGPVGLGWAMNAGGAISRTVVGQDDITSSYFVPDVPRVMGNMEPHPYVGSTLGNYGYDFFCNYKVYTDIDTVDFWPALTRGPQVFDLESDIYSFNFLGRSGKFIITRDHTVIMQQQENISITFDMGFNAFTITDEQGNKYYFAEKEYSDVGSQDYLSAWYLSKITTQLNDTVSFNYLSGVYNTTTALETSQNYRYGCTVSSGLFSTSGTPASYPNHSLQYINYANGQLHFYSDANRTDLQGGEQFDSVQVFSKSAAGSLSYVRSFQLFHSYFIPSQAYGTNLEYQRLRLDSVREVSGGYSIPAYSFAYNTPTLGQIPYLAKHGFSCDHWGFFNGANNSQLVPAFNAVFAPPGIPAAQLTRLPGANRDPDTASMKVFSLTQVNYPTGGKTVLQEEANNYDLQNSAIGNQDFPYLELVDTTATYNVSSYGTTTGSVNMTKLWPLGYASNATLTITFVYTSSANNNYYHSTLNKINFSLIGPGVNVLEDVSSTNLTCGGSVCSVTMPISVSYAPSYSWTAYIDPSISFAIFSNIHVTVNWPEPTTAHYNNNTLIAGGLRIKTVTDYSSSSVIAKIRSYNYGYQQDKLGTGSPQQYTYGKLMSNPSYGRYEPLAVDANTICIALTLFSSSINSISSTIQGNIVGYDQVTESTIDPVTGIDIGKTVYTYYNSPDTTLYYFGFRPPGCMNIGSTLNGSLLTKTEYVNKGGLYSKVQETDNYFHTANRVMSYSLKALNGNLISATGDYSTACPPADTTVNDQILAFFYPSVKSERILLDSSYEYSYDQSDPTKFVLAVKKNYYDNPAHYQVTRSSVVDSKGNTIRARIKYPQDYLPNGQAYTGNTILDTMIGRNMVSETIEKQDSLYYNGSGTGYVTGAQLSLYKILAANSNTVVPDKIYKLDLQSPVTNFQPFSFTNNTTSMDSRNRLMASFDQYDAKNNMQQYTTTDQNPVSIIWDYVSKYPIAQAKNAAIADVAATSFEADSYGNWNAFTGTITTVTIAPFPPTGNNYYNITTSATLSKSGLTNGNTYIISYWSKNGAYSITGGTAVGSYLTGKTINSWTYYEHKILATSTTLTISGTGAIDEVRLYPSVALMTTYTYSPLIGMTTSCDADNKVSYYYYDGLGRLKWVKDQDGNIIKTFQYHYQSSVTQY